MKHFTASALLAVAGIAIPTLLFALQQGRLDLPTFVQEAQAQDSKDLKAIPALIPKGKIKAPEPPPKRPEPKEPKLLPRNVDALELALADATALATVNPACLCTQLYIWIRDGDHEYAQALSDMLNRISCSPNPYNFYKYSLIDQGQLLLMRVDLAVLFPQHADLERAQQVREDFRFDAEFNLNLTPDTLKFLSGSALTKTQWTRCQQQPDGKVIAEKVTAADTKDTYVLRVIPPDLDETKVLALDNLLHTTAPIVSADYLLFRSLASIKDKALDEGLYDLLYGGRYVEWTGIPVKTKEGTDLDALLETLGIGNVKFKITKDNLFDRFRSDRRTAQFRSDVTAKRPRSVEWLPTFSAAPDKTKPFIAITSDLRRTKFDFGAHPLYNLFKTLTAPDAHESIWVRANGTLGYVLHNGAGALQEKAPDNVVSDHSVPAPFYRELQFPISCISCHETEGSDGWKSVRNDAAKLISKNWPQLDIPFDFNFKSQADARDRIAGLYLGAPDELIKDARHYFARAVLECTGSWKRSKLVDTDIIQLSSKILVDRWRSFYYDDITPKAALREIGWNVPDTEVVVKGVKAKMSTVVFNRLVPVSGVLGEFGVIQEDPTVAAIRQDIPVGRYEWDLARRQVAYRAMLTIKANPKLLEGATK